ncbi:hypothetical protein WF834_10210 [Faecalibacterium sp. HTF-128]|uniref:DUF4412 domain-containing protein n=1 Tax=Faecalibacterium wellingii TaxID=2929491 RepID=A0AB35Y7I0_9FIRM
MKLRKRLAAVLLSAVMILTGLTACDGTAPAGPAELTWQNSRTKQYFDAKGITAQEYTLTADMMASGQKVELKYAIKGKRAGYETAADSKLRVDADGNVYLIGFRGSNKELEWWQYPAGSQSAESYAPFIRACEGYFMLPDAESIGSIAAGEYKDYYTETIKLHRNGVYATYTYCFEGSELSCILMESAGGMMNNIELKPTADEAVIAIPPVDRVIND